LALCCVKFLYKFFKGDKYSSDQTVSLLIEIKGLSEKNDKAFLIPPPVPRISGSLKILIS
jgi:hypothetical protein